jgi:tRNA pseudouridine65 synthase
VTESEKTELDPPDAPVILWESEGALIVQKRSGELVHNSHFAGPKEFSLKQRVGTYLGRRVYPVHRLDRGTSGALLFARESATTGAWQEALATGKKDYVAIVRGRLTEPHVVLRDVRDESGVDRSACTSIVPIAQATTERVTLIALRLHTGRHHQARRHCVHLRHPIVGDSTHGDTKFNRAFRASTGLERLGLHAVHLQFRTLAGGEAADVFAPLPPSLSALVLELFGVSGLQLNEELVHVDRRLAATSERVELRAEKQK